MAFQFTAAHVEPSYRDESHTSSHEKPDAGDQPAEQTKCCPSVVIIPLSVKWSTNQGSQCAKKDYVSMELWLSK